MLIDTDTDTDTDPDQIKINSRLLFTFMCHSISMLFLRWKKKKEIKKEMTTENRE